MGGDIEILFKFLEKIIDLGEGWVFRGQNLSQWLVTSTLERNIKNNQKQKEYERKYLEKIQKFVNLSSESREKITFGGWYSLIQHYGGNTRFIDFTQYIYTALFFAAFNSKKLRPFKCTKAESCKHAAIWCIRPKNYSNDSVVIHNLHQFLDNMTPDKYKGMNSDKKFELALNYPITGNNYNISEYHIKSLFSENKRIKNQQGLFLYSMNFDRPFSNNLFQSEKPIALIDNHRKYATYRCNQMDQAISISYLFNNDNSTIKIEYPIEWNEKILDTLEHQYEITYPFLFPETENIIAWVTKNNKNICL